MANNQNYKSVALKKHIFAADCYLDMDSLPGKTKTILSKFEMIVIAKILSVKPLTESKEDDINDIDNIDLSPAGSSK